MKKYILSLFAVLVLGFLSVPVFSFAQLQLRDDDPDPSFECITITQNLRYRDRDVNKNGEVSLLQDFLQGRGYLNSKPTGYFGLLTFRAVKDYQKSVGISPTGYLGPITRVAINADCTEPTTSSTSTAPVISGVSGPQSLNIGQQGTWTIKASNKSNGTLNYSVVWGDETYPLKSVSNSFTRKTRNQSAIFTHIYNGGGTFSPSFTVTNESGGSASTSLSVNVRNVVSTNAKPVLNPIAVPESVNVGQSVNFDFSATDADNDDLSWSVSWGGRGACGYPHRQNGANWTYSTNHTWDMAGTYNVKVSASDCRGGSASTSFSVRVTDVDLAPPVISSISGPQLLKIGEQGKWEIKANDSIKTAQLLYSVIWGDEAITGVPITASNYIKLVGQTATFTHTYNTPGIYRPEFEVSRVIMCLVAPCPNGPSAKTSLSVDVRDIAIKNYVSLNSVLEKKD